MRSWQDIPDSAKKGEKLWFDYAALYAEQVDRAKDGSRFAEIGVWKGRSTAYMANRISESGKQIEFVAIDNWNGSGELEYNGRTFKETVSQTDSDYRSEFMSNMASCGLSDKVRVVDSDSTQAAERFDDESFDFVFIDADHSPERVYQDLCAWWPKIKPGGLIAGHDYDESGPRCGADRFGMEFNHAVYGDGANTNSGFRCFGIPKPSDRHVKILLALPSYDTTAVSRSTITACTKNYSGHGSVLIAEDSISLLAGNFNGLWVQALNDPTITHFAMLHSDIVPMDWWLNVLMHELNSTGAQMVSTIVPIKDQCGLTSTGIANPRLEWCPLRRFTMSEILTMPATFDASQVGYSNHKLILNSGCWMADMSHPAWRKEDENGNLLCYFTINDRITKFDGKYMHWVEPEDFFFSKRVQSLGMKALATRKVQVQHLGRMKFGNDSLWGRWQHDEATRAEWERGEVTARLEQDKRERCLVGV